MQPRINKFPIINSRSSNSYTDGQAYRQRFPPPPHNKQTRNLSLFVFRKLVKYYTTLANSDATVHKTLQTTSHWCCCTYLITTKIMSLGQVSNTRSVGCVVEPELNPRTSTCFDHIVLVNGSVGRWTLLWDGWMVIMARSPDYGPIQSVPTALLQRNAMRHAYYTD